MNKTVWDGKEEIYTKLLEDFKKFVLDSASEFMDEDFDDEKAFIEASFDTWLETK